MKKKGMNRRQFLQSSSLAVAGAATAGAAVTMVAAPDGAWAMSLTTLDKHTAETLLKVSRHMYPHDSLGDMYYAKVAEDLDAKAAKDAGLAKQLTDGVKALDAVYPPKWLDLSEGNQLKALKSMESSAFFQTVRGTTVVSLYNNPLVWRHFGYEGPSYGFGGYIHRGFDDLNWLKEG